MVGVVEVAFRFLSRLFPAQAEADDCEFQIGLEEAGKLGQSASSRIRSGVPAVFDPVFSHFIVIYKQFVTSDGSGGISRITEA